MRLPSPLAERIARAIYSISENALELTRCLAIACSAFSTYIEGRMRFHMHWRLVCLLCCGSAIAQNPEAGRIERNGNQATLIVDSPRPVDSAAITLAEEFGMRVNVEDPPYEFKDDMKDVTATVSRDPRRQVL